MSTKQLLEKIEEETRVEDFNLAYSNIKSSIKLTYLFNLRNTVLAEEWSDETSDIYMSKSEFFKR